MWTFVLLLFGFVIASVALSVLAFYLNEFEKKVTEFCEIVRERYRPSFHQDLELKATDQIEKIAKGSVNAQ
jgi:uncharacterized protein involved in cysteine biosynthesis